MKCSLNHHQQEMLRAALLRMDTFENDAGKAVPYKLGAARWELLKNTKAVTAALVAFDEARQALVKEIWPDLAEGVQVTPDSDPENFAIFLPQITKRLGDKDEIDLLPFPAAVVRDNEFPLEVLQVLDDLGLIEAPTQAA